MRYKQKIITICKNGEVSEIIKARSENLNSLEKEFLGEYIIKPYINYIGGEADQVIPGKVLKVIHNRHSRQSLPYFIV